MTEATTRAAIYCRVSTIEQASADATSLEDQEARCRAYADAQAWAVTSVFIDAGASGAKSLGERPEGARLLAAAQAGEFDRVIFKQIDRFGRATRKGLTDFEALEAASIGLVFVKESVDTSTPSGRLFRTLLLSFAEFERETINERTTSGKIAKIEREQNDAGSGLVKSWVAGGTLPLGYVTEEIGGAIIEDLEHSPTVKRIFELRVAGKSTTTVAKILTDEGLYPRPRKGILHPWSRATVLKVLKTEAYATGRYEKKLTGHFPENCRAKENRGDCRKCNTEPPVGFEVPTLITPDVFQAAHVVKGRMRLPKNIGRRVNLYGLSERVRHLHADGSLQTTFGHRAHETRTYRCYASRLDGCEGYGIVYGQNATAVSADLIEAAVLIWCLELVENPDILDEYVRHIDQALLAEVGADVDLDAARNKLTRLDNKRQKVLNTYIETDMTREERDEHLAAIEEAASQLRGAIDRADEADKTREALAISVDELMNMEIAHGPDGWRDPNADEPNPAEDRDTLRRIAMKTLATADKFGRSPKMPEWAIEEVERYAAAFGIEVILSKSDDARRPDIRVEFSPLLPLTLEAAESSLPQPLPIGRVPAQRSSCTATE